MFYSISELQRFVEPYKNFSSYIITGSIGRGKSSLLKSLYNTSDCLSMISYKKKRGAFTDILMDLPFYSKPILLATMGKNASAIYYDAFDSILADFVRAASRSEKILLVDEIGKVDFCSPSYLSFLMERFERGNCVYIVRKDVSAFWNFVSKDDSRVFDLDKVYL